MGGFERFTVDKPSSSREVRKLLTWAEHNNSDTELRLRPERSKDIVPIRDTASTVHVKVVTINSYPQRTAYLCTTKENATLTVTVFKGSEQDSLPARATLVRGALPTTP